VVPAAPGQSRYAALAAALRTRVVAGEWPPGSALPAEQTLSAEHGVALGTLRRALELLADQGLIERIHGRGTFVRAGMTGATMMRFFRFGKGTGPDRRRPPDHAGVLLPRRRRRRPDGAAARTAAHGQALGQTVVVDNKPGASGQLAAAQVARATPDGSQLLLDASSFAVNPSLFPKLPYDTATAFAPLAVLALFPNVLVCTPGVRSEVVRDVVRLAKAKPAQIAYASSGNGSAQHLAGALFEEPAGVSLVHVPYKGGGPALNDVMAGQVPLFFANVASSLGHIQGGKLRPLAVTSRRRARALPEVPTMEEAGVAATRCWSGTRCWRRRAFRRRCASGWRRPSARRWPSPKCWAACAA
jgi:hypothetical protein